MTNYVIQVVDSLDQNATKYLAYDAYSGGYPWFPKRMWSAHMFGTFEEALKQFNSVVHGKTMKWSDGEIGAPTELRNAFGLCNDRTKVAGWIHIVAIGGRRWSEISAALVHGCWIEIEEFRNEIGKEPIITIKEIGAQNVHSLP